MTMRWDTLPVSQRQLHDYRPDRAADADYLVTGDADLLELKRYQGVRIITPRNFEALFL